MQAKRRKTQAHAQIQPLDRRVLLSAQIVGRSLQVLGTPGADQVNLDTDGNTVTVTRNQAVEGTFSTADFDTILIDAERGNDSILISDAILKPATLIGGNGNDTLKGGGADDVLIAGLGNDSLDGGGTIEKPGGVNTADYSDRKTALNVELNKLTAASGEIDTLGLNLQRFLSGSGDDSLRIGGSSRGSTNYVDGGAGNDFIYASRTGYGSDVTVHGGDGNDRIRIYAPYSTGYHYGDAGDDTFEVMRSSYTARDFHGGSGFDTVDYAGVSGYGSFYGSTISIDDMANDGAEVEYENQPSADNVHSDVESFHGSIWGNRVFGTAGDETMTAGGGPSTFFGAGGRDCLVGAGGSDLLISAGGISTLIGGAGADTLVGSAQDTITSDPTDTVIDQPLELVNGVLAIQGSNADDKISVLDTSDPSWVIALFNGQFLAVPTAGLQKVIVLGNGGADSIQLSNSIGATFLVYGGDGNDTIIGGSGRDAGGYASVAGGAGDDSIIGGPGNDSITGSAGNDIFQQEYLSHVYVPYRWGSAGNDSIDAGGGNDKIHDDLGMNTLIGGAGNDTVTADGSDPSTLDGGAGDDSLEGTAGSSVSGGAGNDSLSGSQSTFNGGDGNDTITTYGGNDTIFGGDGNDSIRAGGGNDYVDAGPGDDTVYGEAGDDTLIGGPGNDILDGGTGNNTIIDDLQRLTRASR